MATNRRAKRNAVTLEPHVRLMRMLKVLRPTGTLVFELSAASRRTLRFGAAASGSGGCFAIYGKCEVA